MDLQNQNLSMDLQQFEPLYSEHLPKVDTFNSVPRVFNIERFHSTYSIYRRDFNCWYPMLTM